jgi:hypothetical protein
VTHLMCGEVFFINDFLKKNSVTSQLRMGSSSAAISRGFLTFDPPHSTRDK